MPLAATGIAVVDTAMYHYVFDEGRLQAPLLALRIAEVCVLSVLLRIVLLRERGLTLRETVGRPGRAPSAAGRE
ncbi:hypothetical protein ACFC00_16105 [Streptomyces adustus]|uniref:hypothetical protein n=1 Tax=Streptomyces adustus TaxID=1609272 RepID=UPI0035E00DE9